MTNHTTTPTKIASKTALIPPNPSGKCMCGCGQTTNRATCSRFKQGQVIGEYVRCIRGHKPKVESETYHVSQNPSGLCFCGCGQATKIARWNDPRRGWIKGEHTKYINGHNAFSPLSIEERFWAKVNKTEDDECWNWTGNLNFQGYGQFLTYEPRISAHRYSYELHFGPIPVGLFVLHNCPNGDNPACVNPAHLWLGTQTDNMSDCSKKGRITHSEKHYAAKLTTEQVKQIRFDYANGATGVSLAKKYNISKSVISNVVNRRTWKHVE